MKFDPTKLNPGDWIGWPAHPRGSRQLMDNVWDDGWNYFEVRRTGNGEVLLADCYIPPNVASGHRGNDRWLGFDKLIEVQYDFASADVYEHLGRHTLLARRVRQGRVRDIGTLELAA